MLVPIKVLDIELSQSLQDLDGLGGYMQLQGLVRLHGEPIGYVRAPITSGCVRARTLSRLILEEHSGAILKALLRNGLQAPTVVKTLRLEDLLALPYWEWVGDWPLVTVAVCTRDRPGDLDRCLEALSQLDYPRLDILVVDNAPTSDATEQLVRDRYPSFRYVCELRPGLDWARNRAIVEAKGEILAYTDDDVVVDAGWVKALARLFIEQPDVMVITGLVVPYELETAAQVLFELYGGFGRGFERKWYRVERGKPLPWYLLGTGQFGTGANMAYRRSVFDDIGPFDPALDVGTVTNGGGDLEMFFRVLKGGHTLVYEPRAVVRHRHRRDYDRLRSQLTHNGTGLFSYCTRCIWHYPKEWRSLLMLSFWWIVSWNLRRVWMSFKHPTRFPRDLVLAELWGSFVGLTRYFKARRIANEIASSCGPTADEQPTTVPAKTTQVSPQGGIAIRTVELSESLSPLEDVAAYSTVRLFAKWCDCPKGRIDLPTNGQSIGVERLIEVLVERLQLDLLEPDSSLRVDLRQTRALSTLTQQWLPSHPENEMTEAGMAIASLPANIPVSVVVATYDRPEDLRQCLRCLIAQVSPRTVELVVVDNHPASGLTPPVVAEFPEVVLVQEARAGLAYARNAGFAACQGQIAVATDDDVLLPSDWLEKLVAPFARADVGIVTGNVLPRELETLSQICFETYGGLGRGFEPKTFDGEWFESSPRRALPTWELGATANAAFRTSLFNHPQVGLMEESLGPGMPSGVGEDTYLFYKVLKAGFTAVYEPAAYVWHNHRRDMKSLRKQIYGYSKGHVAYNLTTWLQDGDWRGLVRVLMELPAIHLLRAVARVRGKSDYPLSLLILEVWGNLAAPWSLWRSRQRVKREGRSQPYLPPHQRGTEQQEFSSELVTEVDSGSEPSPFLPPLTETPAH